MPRCRVLAPDHGDDGVPRLVPNPSLQITPTSARYRTCLVPTVMRDHDFDHLSAVVAQGSSLRESSEIDLTHRIIPHRGKWSFSSVSPLSLPRTIGKVRERARSKQLGLPKEEVGSASACHPDKNCQKFKIYPSARAAKFGYGHGIPQHINETAHLRRSTTRLLSEIQFHFRY